MIKITRRGSLKLFSLAGIAAVLPANVLAKLSSPEQSALPVVDSTGTNVSGLSGSIEISIRRIYTGDPATDYALVKISNTSRKVEAVRHFYSSVVHAEGENYDLNALLANGPLVLMAGESRHVRMMPVRDRVVEEKVSKLHSWSKPVTVKTRTVISNTLQDVQSVRWAYV